MPDIRVREQFPNPNDLSVFKDEAEYDVWLREQFPNPGSYSAFRPILPVYLQSATGALVVGGGGLGGGITLVGVGGLAG